jgi:hypothetical protein
MEPVGLLRRTLPLLGVAVLGAILYDGWIFYSRWRAARDGAEAEKAEEVRRARETIDLMGGTNFRIVSFYASPQSIHRGEHSDLCFGVYGAKTVRIEPEVGELHPALSNCLQVAPLKDTKYKLTAEDAAGRTTSATLTLKVSGAGTPPAAGSQPAKN